MAKPTRYTPELYLEYTKKGFWGSMILSDYWDKNGREYPDMEALVDSRTRLTWLQANLWIDRVALGFIELGIKRDDLIILALPHSTELILLRVACERAGILCMPIPMAWRYREIEHVVNITRPVGVVTNKEYRGFGYLQMFQSVCSKELRHIFLIDDRVDERALSIKEMAERDAENDFPPDFLNEKKLRSDEFSLIQTTTGTTGFPKLVENPICSRICMAKSFIKKYKLTTEDIIGLLIPSSGGLNHVAYFGAPILPVKVVILEHFTAEKAFKLIEKERITFAGIVPAALEKILKHPDRIKYDLSSLRTMCCGASALSYELGAEVEEKMGFPIVQNFGAMDSGGWTGHQPDDPFEVRYRTLGKPFDGNEIRIVGDNGKEVESGEIGELHVRGPNLGSGYYLDPVSTWKAWSKEGWYRSGDLGRLDKHGNLTLAGRIRDMIIRGGQNIYPIEIENLLRDHPRISDVAVVAMPDPVMGERACAYVVLNEPGCQFTFKEMISFLKEKAIALYKLPERLEVVNSLPKVGDYTKTDKKVLEEEIREKLKEEGSGTSLFNS